MKRVKDDQATSLLENAIALPIVMFVIIGTIMLAMTLNTKIALNGAAAAGARYYAAYRQDRARAEDEIEKALAAAGLGNNYTVEFNRSPGRVEVVIYYRQAPIVPGLMSLVSSGAEELDYMVIRGRAYYRMEVPR